MKYIVKEDEKKVIAIIENTTNDVYDFIAARFGKNGLALTVMDAHITHKLLMKDNYTGTAKCHKDDIFDVEKGKEIAKAKARKKHDKDFRNKVMLVTETVRNILKTAETKAENKYKRAIELEEKAISE